MRDLAFDFISKLASTAVPSYPSNNLPISQGSPNQNVVIFIGIYKFLLIRNQSKLNQLIVEGDFVALNEFGCQGLMLIAV